MNKKSLLFLAVVFLLIQKISAQSWVTYNTSSGLSSNVCRSITIDPSGNKWAATDGGLDKLTGATWAKSNIPGATNRMNVVFSETTNIWAGTNGTGASKYNGTSWSTLNPVNSNLPGDTVYCISKDNAGKMWFGCNRRLAKFDGFLWSQYDLGSLLAFSSNVVNAVAIDSKNNVWMGSPTDGLAELDPTNHLYTFDKYSTILPDNNIYALKLDNAGNLWIGTLGGLAKFNATANSWVVYTTSNSGIPGNYVTGIDFDAANNVWISCGTAGVGKFNGTAWTKYNKANSGLPTDSVSSICIDKTNKMVWVSTLGKGIAKLAIPTAIDEPQLAGSTGSTVYPNPANQSVKIHFDHFSNESNNILSIFDASGKLFKEIALRSADAVIDCSSFPQGIYYYKRADERTFKPINKLIVAH